MLHLYLFSTTIFMLTALLNLLTACCQGLIRWFVLLYCKRYIFHYLFIWWWFGNYFFFMPLQFISIVTVIFHLSSIQSLLPSSLLQIVSCGSPPSLQFQIVVSVVHLHCHCAYLFQGILTLRIVISNNYCCNYLM